MFVIANLLNASAQVLKVILDLYLLAVILRAIFSWVDADPSNGFVRAVRALTEPVLSPLRRLLPPYRTGGWDLSPLLACLAILFVKSFVVGTLFDLAGRMR
jgi:YggT family protein